MNKSFWRVISFFFLLFPLLVLGFSFAPKSVTTPEPASSVKSTSAAIMKAATMPATAAKIASPPPQKTVVTGPVRAIGNEPFVEIVLKNKTGVTYQLVGDPRLHLADLQGQTITVYGTLVKNTSRYVKKTVKVERYGIEK